MAEHPRERPAPDGVDLGAECGVVSAHQLRVVVMRMTT